MPEGPRARCRRLEVQFCSCLRPRRSPHGTGRPGLRCLRLQASCDPGVELVSSSSSASAGSWRWAAKGATGQRPRISPRGRVLGCTAARRARPSGTAPPSLPAPRAERVHESPLTTIAISRSSEQRNGRTASLLLLSVRAAGWMQPARKAPVFAFLTGGCRGWGRRARVGFVRSSPVVLRIRDRLDAALAGRLCQEMHSPLPRALIRPCGSSDGSTPRSDKDVVTSERSDEAERENTRTTFVTCSDHVTVILRDEETKAVFLDRPILDPSGTELGGPSGLRDRPRRVEEDRLRSSVRRFVHQRRANCETRSSQGDRQPLLVGVVLRPVVGSGRVIRRGKRRPALNVRSAARQGREVTAGRGASRKPERITAPMFLPTPGLGLLSSRPTLPRLGRGPVATAPTAWLIADSRSSLHPRRSAARVSVRHRPLLRQSSPNEKGQAARPPPTTAPHPGLSPSCSVLASCSDIALRVDDRTVAPRAQAGSASAWPRGGVVLAAAGLAGIANAVGRFSAPPRASWSKCNTPSAPVRGSRRCTADPPTPSAIRSPIPPSRSSSRQRSCRAAGGWGTYEDSPNLLARMTHESTRTVPVELTRSIPMSL